MPPRHAYWTIIFGNQPTAFRAAMADELLPTLRQLQSKHPDAVMMWFARGRLWKSPEEARDDLMRRRAQPRQRTERPRWVSSARGESGERPSGDRPSRPEGPRRDSDRRGKDWRPGGAHRDPRDRFKVPRDVKRKRFAARLRRGPSPGGPRRDKPGPPHRKKKDGDE